MTAAVLPDGVRVESLRLGEARRRRGELAELYRRAFDYPQLRADQFADILDEGLRYQGALVLAALDEQDAIVGFVYGFTFVRGQWWPSMVAPWLDRAGLQIWAEDTFELVEFEVDPDWHGQGIGTALLRRLYEVCPHQRIILATDADITNLAPKLYRREGFADLLPGFEYPNGRKALILGRSL